jgi:hypothetical protein
MMIAISSQWFDDVEQQVPKSVLGAVNPALKIFK